MSVLLTFASYLNVLYGKNADLKTSDMIHKDERDSTTSKHIFLA